MTEAWYASKTAGDHQGLVIAEKTGANIAVVYDKAHAALIAAAPELLDVLRAIERAACAGINNPSATSGALQHILADTRAVIAKATGT